MMKKKIVILVVVGIIFIGIIMFLGLRESTQVVFQDEEMGKVITFEAYRREFISNEADFQEENFAQIEELNIGYTGYYTTLKDIEKCYNVKYIYIGAPLAGRNFYNSSREIPGPESEQRIDQIEEELQSILDKCDKIRELCIWNPQSTCSLKTLSFLEKGKQLEVLELDGQNVTDYSPIWQCENLMGLSLRKCNISSLDGIDKLTNLKMLALGKSNISTAEDIVKLEKLEVLMIEDTPLAENEEELALIYEKFPEIEIWK